jgi:outer membrane receptor protein involved in Fe transport
MTFNLSKKIVLTVFALGLQVALFAQGTLQGTIKADDGKTLSGAYLSLPALGIGAVAGDGGTFSLNNIPAGRYIAEAMANGYNNETEIVKIDNGGTTNVTITLGKTRQQVKEVVVTGVSNAKSALESSISISTLRANDVTNGVPRTTAEIFRTIPGIRSESSGGDGNSNITVRGVPVSAGGSRYMLLQEDGLPVLQFGDVAFGTQDQFLRFDNTINKVEALRGGSAGILASNSPAGIINMISKTGEVAGGSIATNFGLTFPMNRTDFEFGSPLGNNVFFHVGGFYRIGDGPRQTGYTSNNGGQLKANITKKFDNGFARVYFKYLNDRTAAYMPMPVQVTGTDSNSTWASTANYDAALGTLHSTFLQSDRTIGGNGNRLESDVRDGMHSRTNAIGTELSFNLGDGWKVTNNARVAFNSGQFLAPFPANVGNSTDILQSIPGYGSATYANNGASVNSAGTFMRIHLFNTKLNNFNNFANNLALSKQFGKNVKVNLGLYKALQNVNMDWHWNTYLMEANTANGMPLVNVKDTAGVSLTQNGLLAYGVPAWGNCCNRSYNTTYDITAPFANAEIQLNDKINVDAGFRYDIGNVTGSFSGANAQTAAIDMNGNGTIDANENAVATTTNNKTPVDYNYNILGYSIGANYLLNDNSSVFVRTSQGGSASADRILFNDYNYTNNDDPKLAAQKVNLVRQTEVGYKYRKDGLVANGTFFFANTFESNYEATTQKRIDNTYRSLGIELDARYRINKMFDVRGGLTFTNARIENAIDTSVIGNVPRRTPAIMFNITPVYTYDNKYSIGFTALGFTNSFTNDINKLKMPGYLTINPFINAQIVKNFSVNLAANNITNTLGFTEAEEGSMGTGTSAILRARSIPGRSISLGLRYNF